MKMMFRIGKVLIGSTQPCAIIAELSGNHGGNFKRIKKLIIEAKKSGADLIKLQTYTPDTITLNSDRTTPYYLAEKAKEFQK